MAIAMFERFRRVAHEDRAIWIAVGALVVVALPALVGGILLVLK